MVLSFEFVPAKKAANDETDTENFSPSSPPPGFFVTVLGLVTGYCSY